MFKNTLAAACILATAGAATAGGFTEAAVEPEVFVVEEPAQAGSLGGTTGIIIGVLALAGIAALIASDDSD